MAIILNIETSTKSTSVAIAKDGVLLAIEEEHEVVSHATKLTPFIQDVLAKANLKLNELDAIGISIGPGSYTGLRIGLSTAKGLCYSLGIPIISISALNSLAYEIKNISKKDKLYLSTMNSRKNELYLCLLDSSLNVLIPPIAHIIDKTFLQEYMDKEILLAGTGLEKIEELNFANITILNELKFSAKNMIKPTFDLFKKNKFEDLAYLEPDYLKPFISK